MSIASTSNGFSHHSSYKGRFAPSPTGLLHAGSLVAALASWLDARVHGGKWVVRIEDVDTPRTVAGAAQGILQQLAACGLESDEPVLFQSDPLAQARYQEALERLIARGFAYPCHCTRRSLGNGLHRPHTVAHSPIGCAWRLRVDDPEVAATVGDFVLKRADGCFTYQLAVVVDDAVQGITHIVRGADLEDNTARQIYLQQLLGFSTPQYRHTPLVRGENGHKLSKQNGARPVDTSTPMAALTALHASAQVLGLHDGYAIEMVRSRVRCVGIDQI
ncbi:MAG: glutamyl-queuosine tRNA(Asp) synthetase [Pseudomonadota bacterium]